MNPWTGWVIVGPEGDPMRVTMQSTRRGAWGVLPADGDGKYDSWKRCGFRAVRVTLVEAKP